MIERETYPLLTSNELSLADVTRFIANAESVVPYRVEVKALSVHALLEHLRESCESARNVVTAQIDQSGGIAENGEGSYIEVLRGRFEDSFYGRNVYEDATLEINSRDLEFLSSDVNNAIKGITTLAAVQQLNKMPRTDSFQERIKRAQNTLDGLNELQDAFSLAVGGDINETIREELIQQREFLTGFFDEKST